VVSITSTSISDADPEALLRLVYANAILANPSGFYLKIHTSRNPDGVARGQLTRAQ